MNEIDCLLRIDAGGLTLKSGESEALPARLEEWLRTPIGSIYGLPEWGNPLVEFKHEPTNQLVSVFIENRLISKLRTDIPEINLSGIRCAPASDVIDMYVITFQIQTGTVTIGLQKGD
ncbi:hypothetical protein KKI95_14400 [Xenorhabdus bovienii]|uniref:hypothetical protein n=1 Tax=Xenorhabdus bovienii TaxID=40576 RepID=UPI00237CFA9F|nr:hypothetical protein [Xenorhabdus bovienii]MDE1486454.1 hypothetical protein [Xenorhabdus bovienii]MDE1496753.1 hypothetical protein [Xenorhabdus bovienii]MDE9437086.1 hypothetical protein [Xenorhabdus bovienii]MDE9472450.1 hypothetical protein [Xenorhabdus bovienii]MDE9477230.1 hypothetical protein [Xenorhabdus bovienii]